MKIYTVKAARKDYPEDDIKKGDTFYYCTPKRYRKAKDRRVKSKYREALEKWIKGYCEGFMGEHSQKMNDWNQRKDSIETQEEKDDLIQEIEEWRDEKQGNLDNIPDQLQESHMLNQQIEELDELLAEVEEIEIEEEDE